MRIAVCLLLLTLGAGRLAVADNWPQFRGPDGQGHAVTTGVPTVWSETENIRWKTPLPGRGWSSPVVWGRQIWITTATDEGRRLRAVCVDRKTGRITHDVLVFEVDKPPAINPKNSYASPTPVIEEGRLYVHFGTLGTASLDTATGGVLWRNVELILDHKEGPGSSPILYAGLLFVDCDGIDTQYVVALDKTSGRIVWKTYRDGANDPTPDFRKAYCTPLVVEVDGQPQLISPGASRTNAYDPATGKTLWSVDYQGFSNVPRPIAGLGMIYLCTGFSRPELWAIKPGGRGNVTKTHVVWKYQQQVPLNPSPLLVGEAIYMVSDRGVASCLAAESGKLRWKARLGGNYSASPVYADGKIYFFAEQGVGTVITPAKRFERLAKNTLDGRIMASPAVVDGGLIVRTDTHLYSIARPSSTKP